MKTDKELLNITRKNLREAKKQILQKEEEQKELVKTIKQQFTRLKELWEYNEDTVLINGTIISFPS